MAEAICDVLETKESLIRQKVNEGRYEEVKKLLNKDNLEEVDENGMSLLDLAAYRGNYEISKLLIEKGANVNSKKHIHGYTSLMFAAIGAHRKLVNLLLESGADIHIKNNVNRTASQMAGFVGNYYIVSLINNYVKRNEIEYYLENHGNEKNEKLIDPIYNIIRQTNINPIKIVMMVEKILFKNAESVALVLDNLSKKEVQKTDCNEVLCFKFYYIKRILEYLKETINNDKEKYENDLEKLRKYLCKIWLSKHGSVQLEKLLRQIILGFPYRDISIFIQMVQTIHSVDVGDEPTALMVIQQAINGQNILDDKYLTCDTCDEPYPLKKCSKCKKASYCNVTCQKYHWFIHKKYCTS